MTHSFTCDFDFLLQFNIAIPILFGLACIFLLIAPLFAAPRDTGMGCLITLTGIPVYLIGIAWTNKPKAFNRFMGKLQSVSAASWYHWVCYIFCVGTMFLIWFNVSKGILWHCMFVIVYLCHVWHLLIFTSFNIRQSYAPVTEGLSVQFSVSIFVVRWTIIGQKSLGVVSQMKSDWGFQPIKSTHTIPKWRIFTASDQAWVAS